MRAGPSPPLPGPAVSSCRRTFRSNAVTATRDGAILVNVQMHGTHTDFISGNITGGVWQWSPKDKKMKLLAGTELAGNNGIELSKDEEELYIAVSGTQTVAIYSLANTAKPAAPSRRPGTIWIIFTGAETA